MVVKDKDEDEDEDEDEDVDENLDVDGELQAAGARWDEQKDEGGRMGEEKSMSRNWELRSGEMLTIWI